MAKDNSNGGVQTSNSLATISAIARSRHRMVGRLRAVAAGRDVHGPLISRRSFHSEKKQNKTRHTFSAYLLRHAGFLFARCTELTR